MNKQDNEHYFLLAIGGTLSGASAGVLLSVLLGTDTRVILGVFSATVFLMTAVDTVRYLRERNK